MLLSICDKIKSTAKHSSVKQEVCGFIPRSVEADTTSLRCATAATFLQKELSLFSLDASRRAKDGDRKFVSHLEVIQHICGNNQDLISAYLLYSLWTVDDVRVSKSAR